MGKCDGLTCQIEYYTSAVPVSCVICLKLFTSQIDLPPGEPASFHDNCNVFFFYSTVGPYMINIMLLFVMNSILTAVYLELFSSQRVK